MNALKIAAPALLLGLALAATPALAQQSSKGDRFGRPADRAPLNARNCSLSRSCSPGPFVSVIPSISAGRKKAGTLHLAIRPSHADVNVDGVYAGRADDFDGVSQRADLRAGTHQVDVRAEGYLPLHFDTRIEKGRTTFHRGTLSPATVSFGK
jgi:PEGA domain-containing protein